MSSATMTPQQKAALALDRNIAVSAGAGSGKTWVLVQRYLKILDSNRNISPKNIVAITFTRKAAAEMRLRIRQEIEQRLMRRDCTDSDRQRFSMVLDELPAAPVNTIHGFAATILREFAIVAGLDPGFAVLDDEQLASPGNEAAERTMRWAESSELKEAYKTALLYYSRDDLKRLLSKFANTTDVIEKLKQQTKRVLNVEKLYRDRLSGFDPRYWLNILDNLAPCTTKTSKKLRVVLSEGLTELSSASTADALAEALTKVRSVLFTSSMDERKPRGLSNLGPVIAELQARMSYLPTLLEISESGENYARILLLALIPLLEHTRIELMSIRKNTALVSFDDLENFTWFLFNKNENSSQVLERLRKRFRYFMVDEFQDTNQRQWELIRPLVSDENGDLERDRLFIVGDPKQSIYGFRNADVTVFNWVRSEIVSANRRNNLSANSAELAPGDIHMDVNFRSRPNILEFTDAVCRPVMVKGESFEIEYESLSPGRDLTNDFPDDTGVIEMLVEKLPESDERNLPAIPNKSDGENWLELMIQHMERLIGDARYNWKDLAVMYPARTRLTAVKNALKSAGIPYRVYKGTGFWSQPEIRDLTALVTWLADSANRTALFTVLRSPLFSLSDAGLLLAARDWKNFPQGRQVADDTRCNYTEKDAAALNTAQIVLQGIRKKLGIVPMNYLIEEVLTVSGGWGSYSINDESGQVIANIEKLLDIVTRLDREGVAPVWETARYFQEKTAYDTSEPEAMNGATSDRVTLLTIHAAKGLEFPVVYLFDLERDVKTNYEREFWNPEKGMGVNLPQLSPGFGGYKTCLYNQLLIDRKKREFAESKRLFYVAMTRARDRLCLLHRQYRGKVMQKSRSNNKWIDWVLDAREIYPIDVLTDMIKPVPVKLDSDQPKPDQDQDQDQPKPVPYFGEISDFSSFAKPVPHFSPTTNQFRTFAVTAIRDFLSGKEEYRKKHLNHMIDHFRSPDRNITQEISRLTGDIFHELLETHPALETKSVENSVDKLLAELAGLQDASKNWIRDRLKQMIDNIKAWKHYPKIRDRLGLSEIPFNIYLHNGGIHGIIDLLLEIQGQWYVIDYKTDRKPENADQEQWLRKHRDEHEFQMSMYALAVSQKFEDQKDFPAIVYFADIGVAIEYRFSKERLHSLKSNLENTISEMYEMETLEEVQRDN